jgi:hypothetical protein
MGGTPGGRHGDGRITGLSTVVNIHERVIPAGADAVGRMIDTLGSPGDLAWPHDRWPAMKLDRALQAGAICGHRRHE